MKGEEDVAVVIKMKPELYLTIICKHAHKIKRHESYRGY
jgi:hypothetical protein